MPRTRPPYPEEFRREAVELVRAGRSIADAAEAGTRCRPQSSKCLKTKTHVVPLKILAQVLARFLAD